MRKNNWWYITSIIGSTSIAVLLFSHCIQKWITGLSVDKCRILQGYAANIQTVLSIAVLISFILSLVFELTTSADASPGHKILNHWGYTALVIFSVLTGANAVLGRASAALGQKIDDEAKAKFNESLNQALGQKNKELLKQFQPTLDEQKRLVSESTSKLISEVGSAAKNLENSFSESENRTAQDAIQVGNEIEYADIPLSSVMIELEIPQLSETISRGMHDLSDEDKLTDSRLLAARSVRCANAEIDLTGKVLFGPKECESMMHDRMFWIWTRPIYKYLNPDGYLWIGLNLRFKSFYMSLMSEDCNFGEASSHYGCLKRHAGYFGKREELNVYDDQHDYFSNSPPSVISWIVTTDDNDVFKSPGVREKDIEFPVLDIQVCDHNPGSLVTDTPEEIKMRLSRFPSQSPINITTFGIQPVENSSKSPVRTLPVRLTYRFKLATVKPLSQSCEMLEYSY